MKSNRIGICALLFALVSLTVVMVLSLSAETTSSYPFYIWSEERLTEFDGGGLPIDVAVDSAERIHLLHLPRSTGPMVYRQIENDIALVSETVAFLGNPVSMLIDNEDNLHVLHWTGMLIDSTRTITGWVSVELPYPVATYSYPRLLPDNTIQLLYTSSVDDSLNVLKFGSDTSTSSQVTVDVTCPEPSQTVTSRDNYLTESGKLIAAFICDDNAVFVSRQDGGGWQNRMIASNQNERVTVSEVQVAEAPDGGIHILYAESPKEGELDVDISLLHWYCFNDSCSNEVKEMTNHYTSSNFGWFETMFFEAKSGGRFYAMYGEGFYISSSSGRNLATWYESGFQTQTYDKRVIMSESANINETSWGSIPRLRFDSAGNATIDYAYHYRSCCGFENGASYVRRMTGEPPFQVMLPIVVSP